MLLLQLIHLYQQIEHSLESLSQSRSSELTDLNDHLALSLPQYLDLLSQMHMGRLKLHHLLMRYITKTFPHWVSLQIQIFPFRTPV